MVVLCILGWLSLLSLIDQKLFSRAWSSLWHFMRELTNLSCRSKLEVLTAGMTLKDPRLRKIAFAERSRQESFGQNRSEIYRPRTLRARLTVAPFLVTASETSSRSSSEVPAAVRTRSVLYPDGYSNRFDCLLT